MKTNDSIEIVTVYTPTEAAVYLLDEYLESPTKAQVIKRLKYRKPPVVKLKDIQDE